MNTDWLKQELHGLADSIQQLAGQAEVLQRIAELCTDCLKKGGKVMFCGNGGSAADSQHLAAEFVGRYKMERPAMNSVALTVDTSILTAIGNDYGYDDVFRRQVEGIGRAGDAVTPQGDQSLKAAQMTVAAVNTEAAHQCIGTRTAKADVNILTIRVGLAPTPLLRKAEYQISYRPLHSITVQEKKAASLYHQHCPIATQATLLPHGLWISLIHKMVHGKHIRHHVGNKFTNTPAFHRHSPCTFCSIVPASREIVNLIQTIFYISMDFSH